MVPGHRPGCIVRPCLRIFGRIVALTLTGVLLVVFAWELAYLFPYIASQDAVGTDHTFYREVGQRWLDTGVYYLPHQLAGPYQVQADVDVLYPPLALCSSRSSGCRSRSGGSCPGSSSG